MSAVFVVMCDTVITLLIQDLQTGLQGNLVHGKLPLPRTLQYTYAYGPTVVLGVNAFSRKRTNSPKKVLPDERCVPRARPTTPPGYSITSHRLPTREKHARQDFGFPPECVCMCMARLLD